MQLMNSKVARGMNVRSTADIYGPCRIHGHGECIAMRHDVAAVTTSRSVVDGVENNRNGRGKSLWELLTPSVRDKRLIDERRASSCVMRAACQST